jgi:hypothetical protein
VCLRRPQSSAGASSLIGSKQIKDHSVQYVDLSKKAAAKLRGQRGPRGFQGEQGSMGLPGAPGATGGFDPAKVTYVRGPDVVIPAGESDAVIATCPAGTTVIGGDFFSSIAHPAGSLTNGDRQTWGLIALNDSTIAVTVNAFAVCAAK